MAMTVVAELETVLALDRAEGDAHSHPTLSPEWGSSTQQLLDELLGRFDDDDSLMCLTRGLKLETNPDFDE